MKLMNPLFSKPICFKENSIPVLVLENPVIFRRVVSELIGQSEGKEGEFVLSRKDKPLECCGCMNVLFDYVHLHTVEKKVQTKLIAALLKSVQETMAMDTYQLSWTIQNYLGKLASLADYPVAYEQSENLSVLLKAMEFRVDLEGLPAYEALYEQIMLIHRTTKNQCFVLVNAKSFFSEKELIQLYKMVQYQKINLMLLESHAHKPLYPFEAITLFDEEMCELTLDSHENIG